jgi:hypothetical protein
VEEYCRKFPTSSALFIDGGQNGGGQVAEHSEGSFGISTLWVQVRLALPAFPRPSLVLSISTSLMESIEAIVAGTVWLVGQSIADPLGLPPEGITNDPKGSNRLFLEGRDRRLGDMQRKSLS